MPTNARMNPEEWKNRLWHLENSLADEKLKWIKEILETAVCTAGCDKGVILLDNEGRTHREEIECQLCGGSGKRLDTGYTCCRCGGRGKHNIAVYDNQFFSPLGEALVRAWHVACGTEVTNE